MTINPEFTLRDATQLTVVTPRAATAGAVVAGTQVVLHGGHLISIDGLTAMASTALTAAMVMMVVGVLRELFSRQVQGPARLGAATWVLACTSGMVVASGVLSFLHGLIEGTKGNHEGLMSSGHSAMTPLEHALRDGAAMAIPALIAFGALALHTSLAAVCSSPARRGALRSALALGVLAGSSLVVPTGTSAANVAPSPACNAGSAVRVYDVAAVSAFIPYTRWQNDAGIPVNGPDGTPHLTDGDPHGMVFVLQQDKLAVTNWYRPLVGTAANGYAGDPAAGRRVRPRPLALRANVGECIQINLTNELTANAMGPFLPQVDPRVSMHAMGVAYDPATGDGGVVGYNADTTVGIGESISYFWRAPSSEGMYLFRDMGMPAGAKADGGGAEHGLYGALAVEPTGSRWFDPTSGAELSSPVPTQQYAAAGVQSGDLYLNAVIVKSNGTRFREAVTLSQDVIPVVGAGLAEPIERFSFNFGAESEYKRVDFKPTWCADCIGEETGLSSWVYGDPGTAKLASGSGPWLPVKPEYGAADPANVPGGLPATNVEDCGLMLTNLPTETRAVSCYTASVLPAYQGDPLKIRFGHAGVFETHVFHLHAHTWAAEPDDEGPAAGVPPTPSATRLPKATTVDSQTYSPWTAFTADLNYGAGARVGTIGDSIFHCHLYPHFAAGFWALLRVLDTNERGTNANPDGQRVNPMVALRDIAAPDLPAPAATVPPVKNDPTFTVPGYPRFIPGEFGWRAPQPVNSAWQRQFDANRNPVVVNGAPVDAPAMRIVAGEALDPTLLRQTQSIWATSRVRTFRLSFAGQTTVDLVPTSTAAQVKAALEALAAIDVVTVTGAGTSTSPWVVRLEQWRRTPSVAITATNITGRAGAAVTVTPSAGFVPSDADTALMMHTLSVETNSITAYNNPGWVPGTVAARQPLPGAPVVDPCPAGARVVTYRASLIQLPVVYNEADWVDLQGRIMVADEDVNDILAGRKAPEPFFFRVNAGDCINFELTNRTPNVIGNDMYQDLVQTNMVGGHIHLVNFDVLSSDGSSNGWNYQQAAFTEDQARFNAEVVAGTRACDLLVGCTVPMPADYDPVVQSRDARGNWLRNGQTIKERWFADYELRTVFMHDHHFAAALQNRGFFNALVVEAAGFDARDPETGQWLQPLNNARGGQPACVTACVGTAHGAAIDMVGPGVNDDFREFGVAVHDFVPLIIPPNGLANLTLADAQNPANGVEAPAVPLHAPEGDQGASAINFRNAPMKLRQFPAGAANQLGNQVDPAYTFSSRIWGDPLTPILKAYRGDNVRIRLIQGSHEEQHNFTVHGTRWQRDAEDPASQFINTRPIGVSEAFNMATPAISCGVGPGATCHLPENGQPRVSDFFYGTTGVEDLWSGAWGVMRVFEQTTGSGVGAGAVLPPLPDNAVTFTAGTPFPAAGVQNLTIPAGGTTSDGALQRAATDTASCPLTARVRTFDVSVIDADITYNRYGDHDPYGLAYVLTSDVAAIRAGTKEIEPLVLRGNEGDCIQVNLTNSVNWTAFDVHGHQGTLDGDAPIPLEPVPAVGDAPAIPGTPWFAGHRVSMHPALVRYDVRHSDGATVGYNLDQTAGPGQTVTYRWYADAVTYADPLNSSNLTDGELGAVPLLEYGDVRGHRHHGLLGALVIGPAGATYHDQVTGFEVTTGVAVDVHVPGTPTNYRDVVLFQHNGLNLRDAAGGILQDPIPGDWPDRGEKAISYSNAPLHHRLGLAAEIINPGRVQGDPLFAAADWGRRLANVFSSSALIGGVPIGDPDTPIVRAYAGDPVRLHVVQSADRGRMTETEVAGHSWLEHAFDAGSVRAGVQGSMASGSAFTFHLRAAGGDMQSVGDYRYGLVHGVAGISAGTWGILRVYRAPAAGQERQLTPIGPIDNPYDGGRPLQVLDLGTSTPVLTVAAAPSTAVIGRDTTVSVTATVRTQLGAVISGEPVRVRWEGTVVNLVTNAQGQAVASIPVAAPARTVTAAVSVAGLADVSTSVQFLEPDLTPPTIVSLAPSGAQIQATAVVTARFSEAVLASSVTPSTLTLRTSTGTAVAGTIRVAADGLSATLTPLVPLALNTSYVASVTNGVTDLAGNALVAGATSSFATLDTQPPPVPTGLRTSIGRGSVSLSWSAVVATDLAGYHVYVDGVRRTTTPITGRTFTVTGLTRGVTYTFGVASADQLGNISAQATVRAAPR